MDYRNFITNALSEESSITDHRALVAIFKKGCTHIITETSIHTTRNPSIQHQNTIQVQTKPVHSRLVVMTES